MATAWLGKLLSLFQIKWHIVASEAVDSCCASYLHDSSFVDKVWSNMIWIDDIQTPENNFNKIFHGKCIYWSNGFIWTKYAQFKKSSLSLNSTCFNSRGVDIDLRDWSRSGGSYGNNTRVTCCPAPGRPDVPRAQLETSRGHSLVKHDQTTLYYTCLRQNTFKITTKSSDVAYFHPLWSHASLLNGGSCSFTHPVAKGRSARGISSGT